LGNIRENSTKDNPHMPQQYPKVRSDLEFTQLHQDGQSFLLVQDPLDILKEPVCVTEFAGLLLSLADGSRTLDEIQSLVAQSTRSRVPDGLLGKHMEELESLGLLDTGEYRLRKRAVIDGFLEAKVRPPSHADGTYPADREELEKWIDSVLEEEHGESPGSGPPPQVLVAPHIDFRVNTQVYAKAYSQLKGHAYDRVVLLGTGHSIAEGAYCPSRKHFKTPLGETPSDLRALDRLFLSGDGILAPNDFPHRKEHALEFQVIFLQRLLGADSFELIPVLCGSMSHWVERYTCLGKVPEAQPFLDALRDIIGDRERRTLVVAGVDFSHVGLRFSHPCAASAMIEETKRHDRDLIDAFSRWDAKGFWETEYLSRGRFNVCGFSTLSTILEVVQAPCGRCLAYDIWDDSPTGSAVTFAALTA
jgi:AmmeMemoRadiSam system protein B